MSKNINDYSLDELRKREYEDTDIHDYTRNEYSYGCTIISYSRHVKESTYGIFAIFTAGFGLPFWINHDNNLRKKRETHYFYTETGEELGSSKEEAIYEADKIGEEKMKQKMYAEASSYFNVAYHLCDDSREEGYKQKRDEANEEIQKENDEKERREREAREREARAREEAREREKRQRDIREQKKRERELERERKQREIREKQEKEEARERERRQREIREEQEKKEARERERRQREIREKQEKEEEREQERKQREIREKQEKEEARERERRQREIREKREKEEARERERRQREIREQQESEEARQREIREREAKGESRERKEKQREANEIYQLAHKMWNEAFLLENYNSATEANKKFEESNKFFLKASTLNPHELIYSNWFSISSLKLEGDCLFNEALSLQEQGNRLRQKQKYEQALVKYQEAQMKYTEGYNRSKDTRFKACMEFVASCIKEVNEIIQDSNVQQLVQNIQVETGQSVVNAEQNENEESMLHLIIDP